MKKNIKARKIVKFSLLITAIIIVSFIIYKRPSQVAIPQTEQTLPHQSIFEGKSYLGKTMEEVASHYGQATPFSEDVYLFSSASLWQKHVAQFSDNKLILFKEIITEDNPISITQILKEFGLEEKILYNKLSVAGYYLYVYPQRGLAYLGSKENNFISEIWYFEPTDYNTFKDQFASDFFEEQESVGVY